MLSPEGSIAPGDTTTLTASVTNHGPSDAAGVAVAFTPPAGLELVSASTGGVDCLPAACAIGSIPAGQTASVSLVVRAKRAARGSTQALGASSSAATQDTTSGDDDATAIVAVRELRLVSVTQTVTPSTLVAGETARLVYDVANSGPSTAAGVVLRVPLPAALRDIAVTSAATCAVTPGELTCTLPDIDDGEHATVTVDATVASDTAGRTLTLRGTIDRVADDPDASDDTDATTRAVTGSADLSLTATDTPGAVVAGTEATWIFRAANAGPSDAPGTELRLPLPEVTTFVRATGATCVPADGVLVCELDSLVPGATRDVTITLAVARDARPGTLALDATVRADAGDPDTTDATAHAETPVKRRIDLEVEQSHGTDPIVAGTRAAFTTQVTNTGPSDASGVIITQPIPEALTGATVELRSATATCAIADGVARCTIPALAVGERAVLVLSGHVPSSAAGAQLFPTATANGVETDIDPADNEATDPATAIAINDLAVTAQAPTTMIITGQQATVQLTAVNNGPSDATDVVVTQQLPADAEIIALDPRCTAHGTTVTCKLGDLTVGQSAPIQLKVRALRPFDGRLLTRVTVRSAADDPWPENNSLAPAADLAAACASVRNFPIRLRVPRGLTPTQVTVRVDGRPTRVFRRGGRLMARVNLHGSRKTRVTVRIDARPGSGHRITGVRTYHPCAARRPSPNPPKV
jgi:uncharacterized repeat protein (TIGR01451 family)